ncbi:MAG TPA: AsmA family protein [Steroidobacteraceae bacterium]|nr:AsmA family protein [Steroidobacteraceae bacterium]
MSRTLRPIGIGIAVLLLLLLLAIAFFDWNWVRGPLSHAISARIHRPVSIAALHGALFSPHPHVRVSGLEIGNPAWAGGGQMLSIEQLDIQFRFWPLLTGKLVLPRVTVLRPDVRLYRAADGRANWELGGESQRAGAKNRSTRLPLLHELLIESGKLSARDEVRKIRFEGTLAAQAANGVASQEAGAAGAAASASAESSAASPSHVASAVSASARSSGEDVASARQQASQVAADTGTGFLLQGNGELNGKPFTLRMSGGPLIWAESHKPYPFDVRISAADIRASARGVVPRPFDLGQLDVTLSLAGRDLADGYYLTGLALPNTPPYSISGHLRRVGMKFEFSEVQGRLGGSDIHGEVTVQVASGHPILSADLVSHALNLADLGPTFGGSAPTPAEEVEVSHASGHPSKAATHRGVAKALTKGITGKGAGEGGSAYLMPTAKLQVERLRGMDATLHYRAEEVRAQSLPLRQVDLQLRLQGNVLRIDPFTFTLPQGTLAGSAVIDVRQSVPAEALDVRLSNVQLAQFHTKQSKQPLIEGTLVGRLRVHGSGDSMHAFASSADGTLSIVIPHGDIEQAFAEFAGIDVVRGLGLVLTKKSQQTPVQCGIADFSAQQGVATVKQLVFDTQVVIVTGKGDVNLRDERLDLQLNGQPKKFRIGVLRTPIEITGTLRHPAIGVKASKLVAQGAIAAALGVIATPFAAIAAFVDPGLNKNANCQALLADAKAMGAPVHTAAAKPAASEPASR